ncbi:MAG TPA: AIR synthase-related protein [Candidatus Lokiarchaeia archaeon]|nr:AIR synthase-related protein [Candidatus Lokiarchaeia archaeon]
MLDPIDERGPGKFSTIDLKNFVFDKLGLGRVDVLSKPGPGRDFNVIRMSGKDVLLVATDPLYINPAFGIEDGTWLGFQIIITDILASGCIPEFAVFSLSLPNNIDRFVFESIWSVIDKECRRMGIAIIAGHTGCYDGCDWPMLGAGMVMTKSREGQYITVDNVKAGDDVLLVNLPGMEAIASLLKADDVAGRTHFGACYEAIKNQAWKQLSIETPASIAREFMIRAGLSPRESISAMHDVAERGVLGAANDLCDAMNLGCKLDLDAWEFDQAMTSFIQHYFQNPADIWAASGQGGVLMICRPSISAELLDELRAAGIPAGKIGTMTSKSAGRSFTINETEHELTGAIPDPFWPVFKRIVDNRE